MSNPQTTNITCPNCGCQGVTIDHCCVGHIDGGPFSVGVSLVKCDTVFTRYIFSPCYPFNIAGKICFRFDASDANDVYDVPLVPNPSVDCFARLEVPQKVRAYASVKRWFTPDGTEPPCDFPSFQCQTKLDLRITVRHGATGTLGHPEFNNLDTAGTSVLVEAFHQPHLPPPFNCLVSGETCDQDFGITLACVASSIQPPAPPGYPPCRFMISIPVPASCCQQSQVNLCKSCFGNRANFDAGGPLPFPAVGIPYWSEGGVITVEAP